MMMPGTCREELNVNLCLKIPETPEKVFSYKYLHNLPPKTKLFFLQLLYCFISHEKNMTVNYTAV